MERPATGRIKAVYGRTKGLVARRRALMIRGGINTSNHNIIGINSAESDDDDNEDDNEKENEVYNKKSPSKRASKLAAILSLHSQLSGSYSDSEDEVVKPSRWRMNEKAKQREEKCMPVVKVEEKSEAESEEKSLEISQGHSLEVDDLVTAMNKNFQVVDESDESAVEVASTMLEDRDTSCEALLSLCAQDKPLAFSHFLNQLEDSAGSRIWRKYGEASYSEVYGLYASDFVVKIIPLLDNQEVTTGIILPDRSLASDVHREIQMTKALAKVSEGFVKMYNAQIVEGQYPNRLLHARANRILKPEETSSASPENFSSIQRYAAVVLKNGGQDLESYEDISWKQAASIFCQVVETLSQGEKSHQFEHRDLHWGNVVIAPVDIEDDRVLIKGKQVEQFRDALSSGVKATIIDYTLSRATIGKTLIAYDFADQSLFEGRGDIDMQFDVYRQMKQETKSDWSSFHPHTNVLWLNYLVSKLIDQKKIPNPKRRSRLDQKGSEELQCRNFLMEVKQLLISKRIESAHDLNSHLTTIDF